MNKLLQKVAKIFLGLSLAAGVGVSIDAGRKGAGSVHAADTTYTYTISSESWGTTVSPSNTITWSSSSNFVTKNSNGAAVDQNKVATGISSAAFTNLKSVTLHGKTNAQSTGKMAVYTCASQNGTYTIVGSEKTYAASTAINETFTLGSQATVFVKIVVTSTTSTPANKWIYLKTFDITCAASTNYTVSFNNNTGSGTMSDATTSGSSYTTPDCTFTKTNYVFSKWALGSASGTQYDVGDTITGISANITLFAIWVVDTSSKITITRSSITDTSNMTYNNFSPWSASDVSGYAKVYANASYLQFNNTPIFNTTSIPGRIKSIKITKGGGTDRTWIVYGSKTPTSTSDYSTSGYTQIDTTKTVGTSGATFTVGSGVNYNYFLCQPTSGSTQISEIVVNYEEMDLYSVTYNSNGATSGTVPTDSLSYFSGDTVTVKSNSGTLAKTGYTFAGWNTNAEGTGTSYVAGSGTFTISSNTELFAKWTINSYTVQFNVQGHGTAPSNQTKQYGQKVGEPDALTATGWTFGGWYKEGACSNAWSFSTDIVVGPTTLYAKWTANTFSISYVLDSGSHGSTHPTSGTYDNVFSVSAPSKTGFTFTGWTVTSGLDINTAKWGTTNNPSTAISSSSDLCINGTNAVYFKNLNPTNGSSVELTANWEIISYTVNGGDPTSGISNGSLSSASSVNYGSELSISLVPSSGYKLPTSLTSVTMGGNTLVAGSGYTYDSSDGSIRISSVTGNVVITATCPVVGTTYLVTYEANGGSTVANEEIVENGHPTFPSSTKTGYNFKGWQIGGEGTIYTSDNASSYTVTGNVTFIAKWAALYTVTFNSNGGSVTPSAKSVEDGGTFTFESPGTKTHYTFDGWTSTGTEPYYKAGVESPAVTEAITYTAHWTMDAQYTVTYVAGDGGTGSFVDANLWGGSYTLKAFNTLSGVSAEIGCKFLNYTVGGETKNAGESITLNANTQVTVNFQDNPVSDVITLATTGVTATSYNNGNFSGKSATNTGHTNAVYAGQVVKSSADTIQMRATSPGGIVSTTSGGKVVGVTVTWDTASLSVARDLDIYCKASAYSTAGDLYDASTRGTKVGTISYTSSTTYETHLDITGDYTFIGIRSNNSTLYISEIDIEYAAPARLSSVTTSGQTTNFTKDAKFSYGGTLTAHYTQGKADDTVDPTSFKLGDTDSINPTSEGTSITTNTSMDVATHNNKYIYVVYTEGNYTRWVCYQITVNYAAVTSVVLDTNAESIAVGESYYLSDITITVNPSNANPNTSWSLYDDGGLVETTDYTFDGDEFHGLTAGTVVFRCISDANSAKYAEFTLTITAEATISVAESSVEGYVGKGATLHFTYGNITDENLGKIHFVSSAPSVVDFAGGIDASSGSGTIEIEYLSAGNATISVKYDNGSTLDTVAVTVKADTVTSVTWSASNIDVFSGAALSTTGWNVQYEMESHDSGTASNYTIKLGDDVVTAGYLFKASDDGKTMHVEYGGVSSTSITVSVTQSINSVIGDIESVTTTVFNSNSYGDTADAWTSNGTNGNSFVEGQGVQITTGTTGAGATSKTSFTNVSKVVVTYNSNKSKGTGSIKIQVGENAAVTNAAAYSGSGDGTSANYTSTFEFLPSQSGTVSITGYATENSIWIKSITIYSSSGTTDIANNTSHKAAQRAAVAFAQAFNAAMDTTENCTTGLDSAWATCSDAYDSFKSATTALGETEGAYAKNLIKFATKAYSDDSPEACIERMMKTYEIMVQKHGKTAFMSDLVSLDSPHVSPLLNIVGQNTNTIAILVIISMVSVTAIGGYFFLKKRKEE